MAESALPRVLIVDREPAVVNSLRRLIRREFEVDVATSVEAALEKLEQFDPDVVISESRMLRMSGRDLLREVRHQRPQTLRLLMSGWIEPWEQAETSGDRTVNRWMAKPFASTDLLAAIHELLAERAHVAVPAPDPAHEPDCT